MALVIRTGMISAVVPGAWRRLGLICGDGPLSTLAEHQLTAQLEEVGIPRHNYGLVRVILTWRKAAVPPDVAFSLWLLRERQTGCAGLPRRGSVAPEDTGPTVRYLQLALAAGESYETDPALPQLAEWLIGHQFPDGSVPANLGTDHGEAGTTARTLRVLRTSSDPRIRSAADRMRKYLVNHAVHGPHGAAWGYSAPDRTLVTGATSLATLALLERDPQEPILPEAVQFLIAAQNASGGWSEVPGHTPMVHNTFNVVRTLKAARSVGIAGGQADASIATTTRWFRREINRRARRTTLDLAYTLRLAAELGMLQDRRVIRLGRELAERRTEFLAPEADLYAETEISALAILECSRSLDERAEDQGDWSWRWSLPPTPPPFLCRTAYIYELMYSAIGARWWIRIVDWLLAGAVVDRAAGLLLGIVAMLGIVSDNLAQLLLTMRLGVRGVLTLTLITGVIAAWLAIKSCAYHSLWRALRKSCGSFITAIVFTFILIASVPTFPSLAALVGLRWLVVDVVAYTADSSGLLGRLLIRR